MPAYYFAVEGCKTGESSDPATDNLITIQYQKIDLTTGEPLDEMVILRAWKSSEKEIVTSFYNQFFRPGTPVTNFIPVGLNLDYAYELLVAQFRKHNLPPVSSHELYYQRPRFDLKSLIVLLNDGRFAGASLDAFSIKQGESRHMEKWYGKEDFDRIEHYIREDAGRFLKVLQYLSKYKSRLGITRKEAHPSRKNSPASLVPAPEPAASVKRVAPAEKYSPRDHPAAEYRATPRASGESDRPVRRDAPAGKPLQKRPAPAARSATRALLLAPERKKSPAARNQLGKHPSAKSVPVKKSPGKRR